MRIDKNGEPFDSLTLALECSSPGDVIALHVEEEIVETLRESDIDRQLEQIVVDLEARFALGGHSDVGLIEIDGQEHTFVELVSGGIFNREGGISVIPCKCSSPEVAIQLFRDALERYIEEQASCKTLYWRVKPHILRSKEPYEQLEGFTGWYVVRSRLLIL